MNRLELASRRAGIDELIPFHGYPGARYRPMARKVGYDEGQLYIAEDGMVSILSGGVWVELRRAERLPDGKFEVKLTDEDFERIDGFTG